MKTIDFCPVCNSNKQETHLTCIDYTTTKEAFTIRQCLNCGFRFTNPRPEDNDLGKYYKSSDYISHTNETKGLFNKTYQTIRKYTIIKKIQLINQLSGKGILLDIGCGTGEFLNSISNNGWRVNGIEPDEKARELATKNYNLKIDLEDQIKTFPDSHFDIITMWHVLEHVPELNQRLSEIHRLLKSGGKAVIAIPNCTSFDAEYYNKYWAAYDVPRHLYHFTPKDIEKLCSKHNFRLEIIKPMLFDSFYVSLISSKYNNTSRIIALLIGAISNIKAAIKNNNSYSSQIYILKKLN